MTQTTTTKQLRQFGCLMGGVFLFIAFWPLVIHGQPGRWWALLLGAALLMPALVTPRALGPLYRAWMTLGGWMSWFNTRLILALGFFGLITPIAIVRRIFRKDSMRRNFSPDLSTYRVVRASRPGSHLYHQY